MSRDRRVEKAAQAVVQSDGWDSADNPLAVALEQARADGSLFAYRPSRLTLKELEAEIARLQAIKRPSVEDRRSLELRRAQRRAGCYAGSPLEQWRAQRQTELLLGPIAPPQAAVEPETPATQPAQPDAVQRPDELNEANLAEAIKWTPLANDARPEWRRR